MISGIYEILNTVNGKRYIGQAANFVKRWNYHRSHLRSNKHDNQRLQNAWNKYGEGAFKFRILLCCNPEKERLREYEQFCFDVCKPEYNIGLAAISPMLGRRHTAESNAKNAAAHIGKTLTLDHRAKIGAALKGNLFALGTVHTPEYRAAASARALGRKHTPASLSKMSARQMGHVVSPETRARISVAKIGKKLTLEHRAKIGAALKGQIVSPEACANISAAKMGKPWSPARRAAYGTSIGSR